MSKNKLIAEMIIGLSSEICGTDDIYEIESVEFENDVFKIEPYCMCEEDSCHMCTPNDNAKGLEYIKGSPNFLFKEDELKVWWYKHIVRSTEIESKKDLSFSYILDVFQKCKNSLNLEDKNKMTL